MSSRIQKRSAASVVLLVLLVMTCSCLQHKPAPGPLAPSAESPSHKTTEPTTVAPSLQEDESLSLDPLILPPIHHRELASGASLHHVHLPNVALTYLRIVIPVGRSSDGSLPGLAEMTALAVLQGAIGPDPPTRRQFGLERLAESSVEVSHEATFFSFEFLSRDSKEVVEQLRSMLQAPGFRQSAQQRALQLMPEVESATYRRKTLESAVLGIENRPTVPASIKDWNCRSFHKSRYELDKARIVWVTDLDVEQVESLTEQLVPRAVSPKKPTKQDVSPADSSSEPTLISEGMVEVMMVAKGPESSHEDWPALWLVAQSLTKSCPALPFAESPAVFRICDTMPANQAGPWKEELEARLAFLQTHGLSASELQEAKRNIVEREARRLRNPKALADSLTRWDGSSMNEVGRRVLEVTDVRDALAHHLDAHQRVFVTLRVSGTR